MGEITFVNPNFHNNIVLTKKKKTLKGWHIYSKNKQQILLKPWKGEMIIINVNYHDNITHVKNLNPNIIYPFNFAQIRYAPANPLFVVKFYSALYSINP